MIEDKLCILTCNIYKDEFNTIIDSGEFNDVEPVFYPHVCLNPVKETEEMTKILDKCRSAYRNVIFLNEKCSFINIKGQPSHNLNDMKSIYHCLELIAGKNLLTYLNEKEKYFVVAPGWLRTWRGHIEMWKLDREAAHRFFHKSVNKVFLLNTGVCQSSEASLDEFADFIGLPSDNINVGLEFMKQAVNRQVAIWRMSREFQLKESRITHLMSRLSNYKTMSELAGTLGKLNSEDTVILNSLDFIKIITGLRRIIYTPVTDNTIQEPVPRLVISKEETDAIHRFYNSNDEYFSSSSDSFLFVRLQHLSQTIGILYIKDAQLKERSNDYLNLVKMVAIPLSLAISSIRYRNRLKETEQLLSIQSVIDPLTGILNRHSIIERLEVEISRTQRENKPLSVAMMDLDHFKDVNHKYGYSVGDQVLIKIVEQVKSAIRPYDYIGRFGGEEFLIVIPGTNMTDAVGICERILSRIQNTVINVANHEIKVTASLGVSTYISDGINIADRLINTSHNALYLAKNAGRNRVVHHDNADIFSRN
jgi:diguanylate cyclase (GGDEF)-like protein